MKGLRKFIVVFLIITGITVLLTEGAYYYLVNTRFEIFGHPCDVYMENLRFEGSEITDLDSLEKGLAKFGNLKSVNLGSYRLYVEDIPMLQSLYPEVAFTYDTWINIEGEDYPIDTDKVSLTDHGYGNIETLITKLSYLPSLTEVSFGENHITAADKARLKSLFPAVNFIVVELYDICGQVYPADAREINLGRNKIIITDSMKDELFDELSLFPDLESVDLHGQDLSWNERLDLVHKYPAVRFGWEVEYNDNVYDSSETIEIDLSKKRLSEADLITLKELTEQIKGLEKLIVCDCGLENEVLGEFRKEIPTVNLVWRIRMGKWSLRTDQVTFSVLIYNYDYERLRSKDIQVLKYCTDLRCLDLGHQSIVDISVIGDYLPELRLLIMADNWINDLTPLAKCKHLHYLELFVNNLTDISPLSNLHELVDVNISYNRRLADITPLLYSPMMERIWLESTSVSPEDFDLLEATYPNAKVVRVVRGRPSVDQGWRDGSARYAQMMDMWFNNYYGDEFYKYDLMAIELGLRDDESEESRNHPY